jgi:hypothetical protein
VEISNLRAKAFFYLLIRDFITMGSVNDIIKNHIDKIDDKNIIFSDPLIEAVAIRTMERINNAKIN